MTAGPITEPKELFLITYESAHWCGASDTHVVVHAFSAEEAENDAEVHMSEAMLELFSSEYDDDEEVDSDECPYSVTSVEEFGPSHEQWKWFCNYAHRSNFYPEVGGSFFND